LELIRACIAEDLNQVKQLLTDGINVEEKNSRGMTSLHVLATIKNKVLAKLLVDNGADIESKDDQGNTPLWTAVMSSKGNEEMIFFFLNNGADPNEKNVHGISPLDLSKSISNYQITAFENH